MKNGLALLVLMLLIVALTAAGCGDTEEAPEAVEEPVEEEIDSKEEAVEDPEADDETLFEVEEWVAPETYQEFVATIKEIRYSIGEVGGEKFSINYNHLGTEEVDGAQTDKVEIGVEGEDTFTMWIDGDGEFRRLVLDGEELPSEMAQMVAIPMMSMVMVPFHQVEAFNIADLGRSEIQGVTHRHVGTETAGFGDLTATVHSVELSVGPPAVPEGESGSVLVRIADFGDFQMVTGWEVYDAEGDSFKGEFLVETITLR